MVLGRHVAGHQPFEHAVPSGDIAFDGRPRQKVLDTEAAFRRVAIVAFQAVFLGEGGDVADRRQAGAALLGGRRSMQEQCRRGTEGKAPGPQQAAAAYDDGLCDDGHEDEGSNN